jgi:hypothetical protein
MDLHRFAAVFLLVVAFAGCQRGSGGAAGEAVADGAEDPAAAQEEDTVWAALLAGKSEDGDLAMEARQYLAPDQDKHGLWKTSREQTLTWVDELYNAGAAKVYAIYSPPDEFIQFSMCASLLVELPAGQVRRAVLKRYNEIDAELWGPDHTDVKDEGQKYLYLDMDT